MIFSYKKKYIFMILSLVVGFLIASCTEIIQIYIPGRVGAFKDVLIDFTGYVVGTIFIFVFYYFIKLIKGDFFMSFDGITLKSIIGELNNSLLGGKINKIFEPNKNEIIFGIYSNGNNYSLDLCISSGNYRLCLTKANKPNPFNAPGFCMLLRKHLTRFKNKKNI